MSASTPPEPWRGVRAVLFDLDGTLYDSAPDLAASANRLRERDGLAPLPLALYRPHASSGARGMLQVAFGLTPDHARFAALRADFIADYADHLLDHGRVFDGVLPLLDALQRASLPWAVVTNKVERLTSPLVAHHAWLQTAGAVVCGDSTPHTKPHPAPVQLAAQRLGVDPADCVMVGDDLRDVQAGLAVGARTVAVRYGYLGTAQPIEAWGAHAIADAPLDLLPWLELP
jgi:N-acetyl-D-muramate 6-phosphate phosphatase